MKTIIRNFGVILCIVIISSGLQAQKKIDLMLIVETDSITQENIPQTCRFEDQTANTSVIDYLTNVSLEDEIKWKVKEADNNSAKVKLVKFKHDNGTRFFGQDSIPERNGRIKGRIVEGNQNEEEKYSLIIKVKNSNNDWQEYTIDPKLKLTPRE